MLLRVRYNFEFIGLENIPKGAVLLLGNHVSWIDWIILQIPLQRRINYMMDKEIYHWKFAHAIFKKGEAIPVSPKASKDALKEAYNRLKMGRIVAIFPEGEISKDSKLSKFHRGYELIKKDYDGCIVAFYIEGMAGSIFSRTKKPKFFKRRKVTLYFSKPLPKDIKADELKEIVEHLKDTNEVK
jgi:acyl-[acyl-carrier-protein]-phospholipid O-acyltransferase/long-chain-fatty-acid--[acyl-carrier-protein] ligase